MWSILWYCSLAQGWVSAARGVCDVSIERRPQGSRVACLGRTSPIMIMMMLSVSPSNYELDFLYIYIFNRTNPTRSSKGLTAVHPSLTTYGKLVVVWSLEEARGSGGSTGVIDPLAHTARISQAFRSLCSGFLDWLHVSCDRSKRDPRHSLQFGSLEPSPGLTVDAGM